MPATESIYAVCPECAHVEPRPATEPARFHVNIRAAAPAAVMPF